MRPATPLICAFGDKHKHTYGVTPICRALAVHGVQIASRTYFADRAAAPSKRALWDTTITEILAGYYEPDAEGKRPPECLYGSLKMWAHLQRQGFRWPSATVKTIMRANGWRGVPLAAHITHHRTRPGRGPGPRPGGSAMAGFSNEPAGSGRLHLRADDVEFRLHRVRGRRPYVKPRQGPTGPNAATAARFVAGRSAPWLTWKTSPRRGWSTPVTHNKVCEYPGGFNLRSGRKRFTTRSA